MKKRLLVSGLTIMIMITMFVPLGCSSTPDKTGDGINNDRWMEMLKLIPEII